MKRERIVVTGIGLHTSLGNSRQEVWEGLAAGRSAAGPITTFDTTGFRSTIAAAAAAFDPSVHLGRKRTRRMARFSQMAASAAIQAVADAGFAPGEWADPARVAVVIGTAAGDYHHLESEHAALLEKGPGAGNPLAVPLIIPNMSSANVAIDIGATGPNIGTTTACSSGAHAIALALMLLHADLADVVIAGGAESAISPLTVNSYGTMGVLTSRNDEPLRASRPFDADRDGFLIGEGAGVLVLERERDARARNAHLLGCVAGAGMSADAHSIAIPEPAGSIAARTMVEAVRNAGLELADIGYINAHGTSTVANDRSETKAIRLAFGPQADSLAVSSTKSMIGHTLGAAGAVEAAATILALHEQILPPTINYETPDPECDLDYVPNLARPARVSAALSNSFGFGGQNCTLAFTTV